MTNFIPIFPLQLVVFPGEHLNLHIFEPRYQQLITECYQAKKPFGIPVVIDKKIQDYGSLIHVQEIVKTYPNGEMDIKTTAEKVFRVLEVIPSVPEKLYSGAIVNFLPNDWEGSKSMMKTLIQRMRDFHARLQVEKQFYKSEEELTSFDIAHHSGLTLWQEYELLQLTSERQRQEYLKKHFEALPAIEEAQKIREKIQMNGHFRYTDGFEVK